MAQAKGRYPGYGVVYPQKSTTGLRYVRIVADGAKKIRHADGSIEYAAPQPTILELVGGAFAYASGQVVNRRQDLEWLPEGIKIRALKWFDQQGFIPKEAIVTEPAPEKKVEPDTKWVLSSERPDLLDLDEPINGPTRESPNAKVVNDQVVDKSQPGALDKILMALGDLGVSIGVLTKVQQDQGERLAAVEKGTPKVSDKAHFARKAHSEHMKKVWADRKAAKESAEKVTDAGAEVVTDDGHVTETDQEMQAV